LFLIACNVKRKDLTFFSSTYFNALLMYDCKRYKKCVYVCIYTHVYNLRSLDICIHLWYYHHQNQGNKPIYHFQKFPVPLFSFCGWTI
jgi:hypothetical protein